MTVDTLSQSFCDECGPAVRARVVVSLPSGNALSWCMHHATKHRDAVRALGGFFYTISDLKG